MSKADLVNGLTTASFSIAKRRARHEADFDPPFNQ
jgi:hypothetical protein